MKKKKNPELWIEEFIFLFYLPFGFGSFFSCFVQLWGGLSFPLVFSPLPVSSSDTARFPLLSRKSDKPLFEKPAPPALPCCSAPVNKEYSLLAVVFSLLPVNHSHGCHVRVQRGKKYGGDRQKVEKFNFI